MSLSNDQYHKNTILIFDNILSSIFIYKIFFTLVVFLAYACLKVGPKKSQPSKRLHKDLM